jgi:hypothetical protein
MYINFKWAVDGLSPRKLGSDLGPANVRYAVEEVIMGHYFLRIRLLSHLISVSADQYPMLISISTLLYQKVQAGEPQELLK